MKKVLVKVLVVAALIGAALFGGTSTASAAPQSGSCGPHSTVSTPQDLVDDVIDMSIYPEEIWPLIVLDIGAIVDKNEDGIVCWRYRTPNPGQDQHWSRVAGFPVTDYVATFVTDNNVQGG